jgi:hypothetical protein
MSCEIGDMCEPWMCQESRRERRKRMTCAGRHSAPLKTVVWGVKDLGFRVMNWAGRHSAPLKTVVWGVKDLGFRV